MRTEKVNFYSEGIKLAGVLYLPDSDQGKPFPGIVQGPGFLGLKDDHRQARIVLPCPVSGYETWGLRYPGYDLLAQMALGGLLVVDRDRSDDCVHGCSFVAGWDGDSIRLGRGRVAGSL